MSTRPQCSDGIGKPGCPPKWRTPSDADLGLGRGELFTGSGDLCRLIGRPTTPLADAIAAALR